MVTVAAEPSDAGAARTAPPLTVVVVGLDRMCIRATAQPVVDVVDHVWSPVAVPDAAMACVACVCRLTEVTAWTTVVAAGAVMTREAELMPAAFSASTSADAVV